MYNLFRRTYINSRVAGSWLKKAILQCRVEPFMFTLCFCFVLFRDVYRSQCFQVECSDSKHVTRCDIIVPNHTPSFGDEKLYS